MIVTIGYVATWEEMVDPLDPPDLDSKVLLYDELSFRRSLSG